MTPNRTWAALRRLSQALFLAAVATGASVQISRAEGDLQKVSVRLDWLPGSNHAALFLARERGYYKDAGLDVEILPGQGSVSTLQLIGSGNHTIGLASLSAMALANSKGAPIIAIAGIMQRGPEAVVALASSNITKPSDLEGKKFGAVPSGMGPEGAFAAGAFAAAFSAACAFLKMDGAIQPAAAPTANTPAAAPATNLVGDLI